MKVLILAAGYGTRLYPVTRKTPKAFLKIGGRKVINIILGKVRSLFKKYVVSEVVIVTNSVFYDQFCNWKKHNRIDVTIIDDGSTSNHLRKGSVGSIKVVFDKLGLDDWVVIGSDNIFTWELDGFVESALRHERVVVGVYKVKDMSQVSRFGEVTLDNDNIVQFREKPSDPKSRDVATCIFFLPKRSVKHLNEFCKVSTSIDNLGNFFAWLLLRDTVKGYRFSGRWEDIGTKEVYDGLR